MRECWEVRAIPSGSLTSYSCDDSSMRAPRSWPIGWQRFNLWFIFVVVVTAVATGYAQDPASNTPAPAADKGALQVNWLYGSFVPKEVPLEALTPAQRWKLYTRMTYTTYGIYIKTGFFTLRDQIANSPPEWGQTAAGFGKRLGTRQAQFVIQNSLTALGDAAVGWELRYDRCRCDGLWPRTWHSIARNFVTYDRTEKNLRPQLMPYAAAFGAAVAAAAWQPDNPNLLVKGYQGAITQAGVGIGINWLAEFAPEIKKVLRRNKDKAVNKP